jgi:RNA polymerase sigma-B factor
VRLASDSSTEELLRRCADLPADHPGRAELRVRGIEASLPLARRLATRYQGRGEPLDDLYQVAALALVKAVDGYDPARAVAFTSYAVPNIVGALKRHFRDTTWRVRVPRRIQELSVRLGPILAALTQQLSRSPSVAELAVHLDATEDDVATALDAWRFRRPESLDALSATGRGEQRQPVIDSIGAVDTRFDAVIDWHNLRPLLAALPERERRIVAMRYFGDLTQAEIAVRLGLSQMHISRLLVQTLTQLRAGILVEHSRAPRAAPTWRHPVSRS